MIRLEVTGTDASVALDAPLWILEGKARYAEAHPEEEVYIVHVLNPPRLKRPILRVLPGRGLLGRYPVQVKYPRGVPERYLVIPVTAPDILREERFLALLEARSAPPQRQLALPGLMP